MQFLSQRHAALQHGMTGEDDQSEFQSEPHASYLITDLRSAHEERVRSLHGLGERYPGWEVVTTHNEVATAILPEIREL